MIQKWLKKPILLFSSLLLSAGLDSHLDLPFYFWQYAQNMWHFLTLTSG